MNQPDLASALADCLARIEAGASPATVLADYPSLAADLAPMIAAATAVTQLPPALPRPGYRAQLAGELAQLEARLAAERIAPPAGQRFGSAALIIAALVLLGGVIVVGTRSLGAGWSTARTVNPAAPAAVVGIRADRHIAPAPIARQRPPTNGAHRAGLALAAGGEQHGSADVDAVRNGGVTARPTAATGRPRANPPTGAGLAAPRVAVVVPAVPSPTQPLPPSAEPTAPTESTEPPSSAPRHTSTPPPSPTATSETTATAMADGQLGGRVMLGNSPLVSVTVGIFLIPDGAKCVSAADAEPLVATQTNASGNFDLNVPSGEARYQLAAWGGAGPHCFPRRWHTGPTDLALPDPCDMAVQQFIVTPGFDASSMDIRFAASDTTPCEG